MPTFNLSAVDLGDTVSDSPEFNNQYPFNPVEGENPEAAIRSTLSDETAAPDAVALSLSGWDVIPARVENVETGEVLFFDIIPNAETREYEILERETV